VGIVPLDENQMSPAEHARMDKMGAELGSEDDRDSRSVGREGMNRR
jgi:hypothetical protein